MIDKCTRVNAGTAMGQDLNLATDKVLASRNFANKLWNAGKFILLNLPPGQPAAVASDYGSPAALAALPLTDRWILSSLHQVRNLSFYPLHYFCLTLPSGQSESNLCSCTSTCHALEFAMDFLFTPNLALFVYTRHLSSVTSPAKPKYNQIGGLEQANRSRVSSKAPGVACFNFTALSSRML